MLQILQLYNLRSTRCNLQSQCKIYNYNVKFDFIYKKNYNYNFKFDFICKKIYKFAKLSIKQNLQLKCYKINNYTM